MDCQQYWLVALPLEDRISRGAAGAEQLLKVLNDKTSPDLATNYKVRVERVAGGPQGAPGRSMCRTRHRLLTRLAPSSRSRSCAWALWTRCWR